VQHRGGHARRLNRGAEQPEHQGHDVRRARRHELEEVAIDDVAVADALGLVEKERLVGAAERARQVDQIGDDRREQQHRQQDIAAQGSARR
jgi:hypothetical protein